MRYRSKLVFTCWIQAAEKEEEAAPVLERQFLPSQLPCPAKPRRQLRTAQTRMAEYTTVLYSVYHTTDQNTSAGAAVCAATLRGGGGAGPGLDTGSVCPVLQCTVTGSA